MEIDLRTCSHGDLLITKHGKTLRYIKPLPEDDYYDHEVQYLDEKLKLGKGSRTHDGHVFRNVRKEEDEDVVEIIKSKP